jgi:hypothetical protein
MMLLWRAYTLHNNMTHASGHTSISDSVFFLLTFRESLLQVRQQEPTVDAKGKGK